MIETRPVGARKRLPKQFPFCTTLTEHHRTELEAYADAHGISLSEALRRAIDLLGRQQKPVSK